MATIGFTGPGHMGRPMVKNLINAGHTLVVHDIESEAVDALVQEGASAARTAGDAAKDADVVFTMLQTGKQVKGVFSGAMDPCQRLAKPSVPAGASRCR